MLDVNVKWRRDDGDDGDAAAPSQTNTKLMYCLQIYIAESFNSRAPTAAGSSTPKSGVRLAVEVVGRAATGFRNQLKYVPNVCDASCERECDA